MSFSGHTQNDFVTEKSRTDSFEEGVEDTSNLPVIFIDPDHLQHDNMQKNIQAISETVNKQFRDIFPDTPENINPLKDAVVTEPGDTPKDIPLAENRHGIKKLVSALQDAGPAAMPITINGQKVCLVNKPGHVYTPNGQSPFINMKNKDEVMSSLAHTPQEDLKNIKGTEGDIQRAIGVHEGTHCNQAVTKQSDTKAVLESEAWGDHHAREDLIKRGKPEVAESLKDVRVLGAARDHSHATAPFLGTSKEITQSEDHLKANHEFQGFISKGKELFGNDTEGLINGVDTLVKGGEFADEPEGKAQAQDYIETVRRQTLNQDPETGQARPLSNNDATLDLKNIQGGQPEIIQGDIKDTMEIGGVKASSFFNSHSDPGAAQQRLDQQAKLDVGVNNEANLTAQNNQPSMATAPATPMTI